MTSSGSKGRSSSTPRAPMAGAVVSEGAPDWKICLPLDLAILVAAAPAPAQTAMRSVRAAKAMWATYSEPTCELNGTHLQDERRDQKPSERSRRAPPSRSR